MTISKTGKTSVHTTHPAGKSGHLGTTTSGSVKPQHKVNTDKMSMPKVPAAKK